MKAIRIHSYGGPEVLVYEDAPRPTPATGEVLVKVCATSLNPVDRFIRAGYMQGMLHLALPFVPGFDLAGVIEAVASDVTMFAVGDAVYGYSNMMRQGAYAEYAVVSAGEIAPKPTTVDFVAAYQACDQPDRANDAYLRTTAILQQLAATFEDPDAGAAFLTAAASVRMRIAL